MSIYSLSNIESQVYRNICDALENSDTHADVPPINMDNVLSLYKKALSESNSGYMYNQNQIRICNSFFGSEIEFDLCDEFSNGRIKTDIQIIPEIAQIMELARKEKSVYDAIKCVYSYFVKNFEYAYDQVNDLSYHSAISVFLYRKSVCEGFALALSNVFNRLGIPCGIITGYSDLNGINDAHAWNIVELDRKFYHLDVTWDICTKEKGIDIFDYFFLDDKLARRDHRWSDTSIPVASDDTKDFYKKNGLCCVNEQECINVLVSGLKKKKISIGFRFMRDKSDMTLQNARRLFELAVNKGYFEYRSVSFSINSTCGTVHFLVSY